MSHNPAQPLLQGNKSWRLRCEEYVELVNIKRAMALAAVSRRTVYNYIQSGISTSSKSPEKAHAFAAFVC